MSGSCNRHRKTSFTRRRTSELVYSQPCLAWLEASFFSFLLSKHYTTPVEYLSPFQNLIFPHLRGGGGSGLLPSGLRWKVRAERSIQSVRFRPSVSKQRSTFLLLLFFLFLACQVSVESTWTEVDFCLCFCLCLCLCYCFLFANTWKRKERNRNRNSEICLPKWFCWFCRPLLCLCRWWWWWWTVSKCRMMVAAAVFDVRHAVSASARLCAACSSNWIVCHRCHPTPPFCTYPIIFFFLSILSLRLALRNPISRPDSNLNGNEMKKKKMLYTVECLSEHE